MANELDRLMALDPLELSSQDIDTIIDLQRKARANFEMGVKPKKEIGPKTDIMEVMKVITPPAPAMPRRKI